MTTYTTIADTEIDQDSPVTETLMTKMRDNPIAITEGASGAPRIVQNALSTTNTTYSGTIAEGVVVDITMTNTFSFFPDWSTNMPVSLLSTAGQPNFRVNNNLGAGNQSYTFTWRSIDA